MFLLYGVSYLDCFKSNGYYQEGLLLSFSGGGIGLNIFETVSFFFEALPCYVGSFGVECHFLKIGYNQSLYFGYVNVIY